MVARPWSTGCATACAVGDHAEGSSDDDRESHRARYPKWRGGRRSDRGVNASIRIAAPSGDTVEFFPTPAGVAELKRQPSEVEVRSVQRVKFSNKRSSRDQSESPEIFNIPWRPKHIHRLPIAPAAAAIPSHNRAQHVFGSCRFRADRPNQERNPNGGTGWGSPFASIEPPGAVTTRS